MVSHIEVAREFKCGRKSKGSRMYTDGTTIWSYGVHFPIAHWVGIKRVLFNTDKYSSSTSKHKGYVSSEIRDCEVIECNTYEIRRAVDYNDEVIVITKKEKPKTLNEIMEALKEYCKSKGVKRFPRKKIEDPIKKICFMAGI